MEEVLLQYGALGVMVLGLGWGYIKKDAEVKALNSELLKQSEDRRTETLDREKALFETMSSFSQATELLTGKIVDVQRRKR